MPGKFYKNGSFGVMPLTQSIEKIEGWHKAQFQKRDYTSPQEQGSWDPQLSRAKSMGHFNGSSKEVKFQHKYAPMATDLDTNSRREHNEKEIGDGPANRVLAEYFRPAYNKPPDLPFEMLCGGTSHKAQFPKHSKRRAKAAKLPAQPPDREGRNIIGSSGFTASFMSSTHGFMDSTTKRRQAQTRVDAPSSQPIDSVKAWGPHVASDFLSASQRAFGSRVEADRLELMAKTGLSASGSRREVEFGEARPATTQAFSNVHLGLMGVGATDRIRHLVQAA